MRAALLRLVEGKFMESIYWVVSRDCNQRCRHCYNDSEPGAPGLKRRHSSRWKSVSNRSNSRRAVDPAHEGRIPPVQHEQGAAHQR